MDETDGGTDPPQHAGSGYRAPARTALGALSLAVGVSLCVAGSPLYGCTRSDGASDVPAFEPPVPMSDRDRAPLFEERRDGSTWLVHPTLRFALRHPGDGFHVDDAAIRAMIESAPESARRFIGGYRFAREDGAALIITLFGGHDTDASSFDDLVRGVSDGVRQRGGTIAEISRSGSGASSRADLEGVAEGTTVRMRVGFIPFIPGRGRLATAITIGITPPDDPDLLQTLESLRAQRPARP